MDRKQVESKAAAIMDRPLHRQAAVRSGLDAAERVQRRTAVVALACLATGGLAGHALGLPVVRFALAAGLFGFLLARIWFWVLGRRAVSARQ